ncbi:MAG: carboxypeptidase-like regulatory domain-containing protein, partial [Bacteroidota bacterium]
MPYYFLSFLFIFSIPLCTQTSLTGRIVDAATGKGLAYVNIGVVGKNVGTVSAPDGRFNLRLPTNLNEEQLKISMLGYKSRSFRVSEFRKKISAESHLPLHPQPIELQEVVVVPKYSRTKVLGNKAVPTRRSDGFDGDVLGREGGIIVKLKKRYRPAQILKFSIYIARNDYDLIKFRVNFYSVKN